MSCEIAPAAPVIISATCGIPTTSPYTDILSELHVRPQIACAVRDNDAETVQLVLCPLLPVLEN